jgi:hypothetical protein
MKSEQNSFWPEQPAAVLQLCFSCLPAKLASAMERLFAPPVWQSKMLFDNIFKM